MGLRKHCVPLRSGGTVRQRPKGVRARGAPPLAWSVGWVGSGLGPVEADSSVVGMSVDLEASLVDDDVVVEPAEGDQIIGIGRTAL